MTTTPTRYVLHLVPLPQADDPDGIRRLRLALKALLRSYRLRCTRCEPADDDQKQEQEG